MLEISAAGVAAMAAKGLPAPQAHTTKKGWFLEGQVMFHRDPTTDQLTLKFPDKYLQFRPYGGPEIQLEWKWVIATYYDIATLEDIRIVISNRDLRYATGADALQALLADIDPDGSLGLKRGEPKVYDDKIILREGWLSQYLVHGPMQPSERMALMQNEAGLGPENPLGVNPINPSLVPQAGGAGYELVLGLAAAEKYGEVEPGVADSCRALAHFLCDTLYISPDDVPVTARERAQRVVAVVHNSRGALLTCVRSMDPGSLSATLRSGAPSGLRRVSEPDSYRPLTVADEARAALEILDGCPTPRKSDLDAMVAALIGAASGRADFLAEGTTRPVPAECRAASDDIGQRAFAVLLHFAAPPKPGDLDTGAAYRALLLSPALVNRDGAHLHAARQALIEAGLGQTSEVEPLLNHLFEFGMNLRENDAAGRDNIAYILGNLPAHIPDAKLRQLFLQSYAEHLNFLDARQKANSGDRQEQMFLDRLRQGP